jgi:mannose-1-phosphate guanylyltransferase
MRSAMILSAGLGTRLRPLTDELPKPLVPVGDRPAVAHIQAHLHRSGWARQIVNTHYQMERFEQEDQAAGFLPGTVFLHEPTILGTAGALANARDAGVLGDLGSSDAGVLVWNGDILAAPALDTLLSALRARPHLDAVWIVAPRPLGQGTVGIDADGLVCRVRAHRRGVEVLSGDFLGISMLSARLIRELPDTGCLVGDVVGPRLDAFDGQRGAVGVVRQEAPWDDLGSPWAYLVANQRWLREHGKTVFVGAGANAPSGTSGVIGSGAQVTGRAAQDVVVWPGAVGHDLPDGSILTTGGRLVTPAAPDTKVS